MADFRCSHYMPYRGHCLKPVTHVREVPVTTVAAHLAGPAQIGTSYFYLCDEHADNECDLIPATTREEVNHE